MSQPTRNKPALVLGLIAAGLLAMVIVLLAERSNGSDASPQKLDVVTVNNATPKPQRTGGELSTFAGKAVASNNESFHVDGTIEGSTLEWNGQAGNYLPTASFKRPATLVVDADDSFGIFSGSIVDDTVGRLWFVTNSYVLRHMKAVAVHVYLSRLTAASVTARGNTFEAVVGPAARAVQLNTFQVSAGSSSKQIVDGRVEITVSEQGVRGEIELYGGGFIEPGNSFPVDLIRATFTS